jgi:hypothetical protein
MSTGSAYASLITINPKGEAVWNVLAFEAENNEAQIEVKRVYNTPSLLSDAKVTLLREGGKVSLSVESDGNKKEADVTNFKDNLIEVEARPETSRIRIGNDGEKFSIEQNGYIVKTAFPIEVDSKTSKLSVVATSGIRFIAVLPNEAVENVYRANIINEVDRSSGSKIELLEDGRGELKYNISGERLINILNVHTIKIPVIADVSALSGKVLNVDEPIWLKIFGFMFS